MNMGRSGRTKHVLVINQFALPRDQGGGTRHADLFNRIPGWRALILAGDRNHYTRERFATTNPLFRLVSIPRAGAGAVSRLRSWIWYVMKAGAMSLRIDGIDVIVGSSPHLLAPVVGRFVATVKRVPFVLEIRDLWPESLVSAGVLRESSPLHRALAVLERWLAIRADAIIVVTPGWDRHFSELGVPGEKIHVVGNGTELSDFQVTIPRAELRRKHSIQGFTAVFAGAHGPKDGLEYIIDAADKCPEINFLLIGSGPAKAEIMAKARRMGLNNVQFRDPIPKYDLPELLAACDVGVHSVTPLSVFDHGMSPNKLFDYLAAGIPIVSNARTPLRAVLEDDQCGRIGDAGSLASNIRAVAEADDATLSRWRAEARCLMETTFSRAAAATVLKEVLNTVTNRASAKP
ncbi:glycosyltransferase family 4 protein [Georgenia thermotolerans]|uniref:Glycosyltransferase n=1 Tax=Georgenia thermotolerans TaxID=527326 RepID=A0A7J5USJ4_9MICO|nr:glycosyltransferase family 4 protein [Georgenia thermotolerans]KAE8765240.1 glycosyltransferase [Georgenia thermotolerans]